MIAQTGGTIVACQLALVHGWAVNLGGGFHHACATSGSGFCAIADITIAIKLLLRDHRERVKKVLIVDLDAHQGNGHERVGSCVSG
jgi:histone deacetylase 11